MSPISSSVLESYKNASELEYIDSWAKEVYLRTYKKDSGYRMFSTYLYMREWILENIGPRPSSDHHLYITSDPYAPCEWVLIDKQFALEIYHSVISTNK